MILKGWGWIDEAENMPRPAAGGKPAAVTLSGHWGNLERAGIGYSIPAIQKFSQQRTLT